MTLTVLEYALGNALLALPLAALAWVIGRTRRNPSVAHFAWVLVMVRLVMPPIASVPWMSFKVPVSRAMVAQPIVSRASGSPVLDPRIAAQRTDGLVTHSMVAPAARAPAAVQAAAAVSATSNGHGLASVDRWMALGLLWLAGTSVVVTVSAARLLHFRRMLRVVCAPADPRVRRLAERRA